MTTTRDSWNFYSAERLMFGTGCIQHLARHLERRGWQRLFVVTDSALIDAGIVEQTLRSVANSAIEVEIFTDGEPEPSLKIAKMAQQQAKVFNPDCILGLGGGSNMDLAKMTAAVFSHGGEPADYFGFDNLPGPVVPLICVPTTAGTGSEVSHAAVLTDTDQQIKVSTLSPYLRPTLAMVDANLTLTCPPKATADSGIDALTHAIEACTATDYRDLDVPTDEDYPYDGKNPLGDCLAEKAIRLIGEHLRTAVKEPDNLAAREGMALAATLAGLAFSNCAVAIVHALEYPLGGVLHCSHGAGNGLLLPYVMNYNLPERTETIAQIGEWLGVESTEQSTEDAARAAIAEIEQLRRDIGIPERIRELGGTEDQLPEFAHKAFQIKRLMQLNPRTPSEADLLGILQDAF